MIDNLYFYSMIVSIVLLYVIGSISKILRNIFAIFLFAYSSLNLILSYSKFMDFPLLDNLKLTLVFDYSGVGFFFGILNHIAFGIILLNVLNNLKKKNDNGFLFLFFFIFYITNLLFFSGNLFTFFILWELVSIFIFFIVGYYNKKYFAGLKYLFMNGVGGLMLLFAITLIYHFVGTTDFQTIKSNYYLIPNIYAILIVVLFSISMFIKSAAIGFHTWVEDAYINSQTNFTAYLSAILSKMGVFGLIILLYRIFPYDYMSSLFMYKGYSLFNITFTLLGTLTALIGTFIAIKQQDIKKVLTYSSIAQVGYIIAAFGIGYKFALLAVITVTTVHFLVKTSLFNDLAFIETKTGSTDAAELGGLIKKIPFSFISSLISIIALAGIVPLFGFAGKWVYYGNMFVAGYYFPLAISFLASTLAFLYCYKILSTVYLGTISKENENRNYFSAFYDYIITAINMIIPIALVVLGMFPYYFFNFIMNLMKDIFPTGNITIANKFIESSVGYWNPLWIGSAVMIVFISMLVIFLIAFKKSKRVTQYDISVSAEVINENIPTHYAVNFYDSLMDVVQPIVGKKSIKFYKYVYNQILAIGDISKKFYLNSLSSKNGFLLGMLFLIIILIWRNL